MNKILETEDIFVVDDFLLGKLKSCADRLCAGSDAMRDEGDHLWNVIWQIQGNAATMAMTSEKYQALLFPKAPPLPEPESKEV